MNAAQKEEEGEQNQENWIKICLMRAIKVQKQNILSLSILKKASAQELDFVKRIAIFLMEVEDEL